MNKQNEHHDTRMIVWMIAVCALLPLIVLATFGNIGGWWWIVMPLAMVAMLVIHGRHGHSPNDADTQSASQRTTEAHETHHERP